MTFPARLTELLEKATNRPWYCGRIEPSSAAGDFTEPWSPWVYPNGPRCVTVGRGEALHADDAALIAYLVNHAEAIRDLVVAAKKAQEAMNVWVNTYAPEFCDKEHVENSRKIISESGGTLAYIADINEQIHEALAKLEES